MLNNVQVKGRIPWDLNYNEEKEFLQFNVSIIDRDAKKQENGFYPENQIRCIAFKGMAKNLNDYFAKGDEIIVVGKLSKGKGYKKDGVEKEGEWGILVTDFDFCSKVNVKQQSGEKKAAAKKEKAKPKAESNPFENVEVDDDFDFDEMFGG